MTNFVSQKLSCVHRRDVRVAALLMVLITVLWLPPLVGLAFGYWPLGEDAVAFFVPMREFAHESVARGTLPLWNPYTFCGVPLMANSQVAFWYPPNWLLGFLPSHWALILDLWLHCLLMAMGGYVLARSLGMSRTASFLLAVLLCLSGPITARAYAGHMTWQAARAYFPWMLWAAWGGLNQAHPQWWVRLSVFSALCVFAGHPPMLLLGLGLCALLIFYWCIQKIVIAKSSWCVLWRPALCTFSALFFALLIAACALLPMRELAGLTVHGSKLSFEDSAVLSGTWKTVVRLFAPEWFGGNRGLQWSQACCAHEESAYIGLLPLLLAILAPWILWPVARQRFRVLALWLLLPFSILMALGANAPLYRIVWQMIPPLQMTRIPVRWLEILFFAGAMAASFAFRAVFEKHKTSCEYSKRNLKLLNRAVTILMLLFGAAAIFVTLFGDFWTRVAKNAEPDATPGKLQSLAENFRNAALFESLIVVILCGILLSLLSRWHRAIELQNNSSQHAVSRRATLHRLEKVVLGFVVLDLLLLGWRSAKLVAPQEMQAIRWPSTIAARYENHQRWDSSFYWLAINGAVSQNVRLANGYDPLGTKRFFQFASAAEGRELWEAVYQPSRHSALWNVAGVTHTVVQRDESTHAPDERHWRREFSDQKWELWRHDSPWPLFYTTTQIVRAPENQQLRVLETLAQKPFKTEWPVVGDASFFAVKKSAGTSTAWVKHQTENQTLFETRSDSPAVLVWNEAAFPGWRAWVGERPVPIRYANYLFQAVEIPAGKTPVRFVYEPQTTRLGIFISLCAGAFLVAIIVIGRNKNCETKEKP